MSPKNKNIIEPIEDNFDNVVSKIIYSKMYPQQNSPHLAEQQQAFEWCNSSLNNVIHNDNSSASLEGLYVADCVEYMKKMPKDCVDLVVTSPPYDNLRNYKGYSFNFEMIARQLYRVIKLGGIVVWVVGDKISGGKSLSSFKQAILFQEIGFNIHDVMIYQKKNTPFMRSNAYTNCYEFMFVLSKGKPKTFNPIKEKTVRSGLEMLVHNKLADGVNKKILKELKPEKTKNNIWSYAVEMGGTTSDKVAFKHPAVFPEKLALDHILSWSNEGDLVFDPMCGSGTTCKMANIMKRKYLGIDISSEYIDIARLRLNGGK
jgi:site-specific DNA-methyltransferase (adenine-specific)